MDGDGNIQFLGEGEIGVDRRIARRDALVLESDLAHYLETASGEIFSQLVDGDALTRSHPDLEGCAGDDPGGCGILPFLDVFGFAEDNGGDVEAVHLSEYVFHILARRRGIKRRRA